jgi:hypothetical protein
MATITLQPKWKVFREYNEIEYKPLSVSSGRIIASTNFYAKFIYSIPSMGQDEDFESKNISVFDYSTQSFVAIEKISDLLNEIEISPDKLTFTIQDNVLIAYDGTRSDTSITRKFRIYYGCKILNAECYTKEPYDIIYNVNSVSFAAGTLLFIHNNITKYSSLYHNGGLISNAYNPSGSRKIGDFSSSNQNVMHHISMNVQASNSVVEFIATTSGHPVFALICISTIYSIYWRDFNFYNNGYIVNKGDRILSRICLGYKGTHLDSYENQPANSIAHSIDNRTAHAVVTTNFQSRIDVWFKSTRLPVTNHSEKNPRAYFKRFNSYCAIYYRKDIGDVNSEFNDLEFFYCDKLVATEDYSVLSTIKSLDAWAIVNGQNYYKGNPCEGFIATLQIGCDDRSYTMEDVPFNPEYLILGESPSNCNLYEVGTYFENGIAGKLIDSGGTFIIGSDAMINDYPYVQDGIYDYEIGDCVQNELLTEKINEQDDRFRIVYYLYNNFSTGVQKTNCKTRKYTKQNTSNTSFTVYYRNRDTGQSVNIPSVKNFWSNGIYCCCLLSQYSHYEVYKDGQLLVTCSTRPIIYGEYLFGVKILNDPDTRLHAYKNGIEIIPDDDPESCNSLMCQMMYQAGDIVHNGQSVTFDLKYGLKKHLTYNNN